MKKVRIGAQEEKSLSIVRSCDVEDDERGV